MREPPKAGRNAELVARYEAGETPPALAGAYGISRARVGEILRRAGVWRRPPVRTGSGEMLWTLRDVAQYLGLAVRTIRRGVYRTIPRQRLSSRMVRFDPAAVRAWAIARAQTHRLKVRAVARRGHTEAHTPQGETMRKAQHEGAAT